MRELKFRAWMKEFKYMEQGLFGLRSDGLPSFNTESILMQYTGLKDKNGKEIYEGDILADGKDPENPIGVVYFYAPQFIVQTKDDIPFALAEGKVNVNQLEYTEVIGNIYENPELINK